MPAAVAEGRGDKCPACGRAAYWTRGDLYHPAHLRCDRCNQPVTVCLCLAVKAEGAQE